MPERRASASYAARSAGHEVLAEIDQGKLRPAYILLGDDTVLADAVTCRLKEKVLDPGLEAFDFESMDAADARQENFRQRICQPPVGPRRLVLIREITRMGKDGPVFPPELGKAGAEELCRIIGEVQGLKSGARDSVVVITGLPSRDLSAVLQKTGLTRYVVEIARPQGEALLGLIHTWAGERGITLTAEAAALLLEVCGDSTATLQGEVEKLATCAARGSVVGPDTVRQLAASSSDFALRDYVSSVLDRDSASALRVLRHLEQGGEQLPRIVAWLTNALLDLVAARAGKLSGYARQKLSGAERKWSDAAELNRFLRQLYIVHKSLFEGKPEPFGRLELWTWCVGCTTRRERCRLSEDAERWSFCIRQNPKTKPGMKTDEQRS